MEETTKEGKTLTALKEQAVVHLTISSPEAYTKIEVMYRGRA